MPTNGQENGRGVKPDEIFTSGFYALDLSVFIMALDILSRTFIL